MAIVAQENPQTPVGVYLDLIMFPELLEWLGQDFTNVESDSDTGFYIYLDSCKQATSTDWPFLPAEALRSDAGDFALWIPSYSQR